VLNNKNEGMWGQAINVPLSTVPIIFGQTACTLIIQINGEGFDTFLNEKHIARLEHRRELASGSNSLFLNFPATDDYNKVREIVAVLLAFPFFSRQDPHRHHSISTEQQPESWTVYKVWWGNKPSLAKGDLSSVAGYKSFNSVHPRKLFVSKLKKVRTEPEVDLRRAELERTFGKYAGPRGCSVSVQKHSTFAFVEFETEREADLALQELSSQYRINRARRTRHEALQEERLAKEKAKLLGKKPAKKESKEWD
jgi:RNA recognition motif-containing protein